MPKKMTEGEISEFLAFGTRTAKVATVARDGTPHVMPVWFVLEGTELGVLQTTKDWASFTARIRNRITKAEGLVTVIVERADPFIAGNRPTVFVQVDHVLSVSGTLREPASAITLR